MRPLLGRSETEPAPGSHQVRSTAPDPDITLPDIQPRIRATSTPHAPDTAPKYRRAAECTPLRLRPTKPAPGSRHVSSTAPDPDITLPGMPPRIRATSTPPPPTRPRSTTEPSPPLSAGAGWQNLREAPSR